MSEWTTPPQSAEYRAPTSGLGVLRALITNLSRRISALEGTAPLKQAGIYLTTLGMRIASSLTVEGDLVSTGNADITGTTHIGGATVIDGATTIDDTLHITGATDIDGTLDVGGTATVTGNLQSSNYVAGTSGYRLTPFGLEVNTITVKDLLIGNDALTNVVTPDSGFATASTFAIPTGQANRVTRASFTLTVPNGCTSALVQATASAAGWNAGGSTDYLYSYLEIGPTPAYTWAGSPTCPNGTVAVSDVFRNVLIEGLSGGDPIVVSIQPYTYVNTWPSSATNSVTVSATCLFMR